MVLPGHPAYKFPISRALLFLTMYALRNNELIPLAIMRRARFRQSGILSYRISYGKRQRAERERERGAHVHTGFGVGVMTEKSARKKSRSQGLGGGRRKRTETALDRRRFLRSSEQQVFADIAYQCHDGRWG